MHGVVFENHHPKMIFMLKHFRWTFNLIYLEEVFLFHVCNQSLVLLKRLKHVHQNCIFLKACHCLCQSITSFQGNVSNVILGPPPAQEANEG